MKILITGSDGFVGRNLRIALDERGWETLPVTRQSSATQLAQAAAQADRVVHLAGVNRPTDPNEFEKGNRGFTEAVVRAIERSGRALPVVFSSSVQAVRDNLYGRSKLAAEAVLAGYAERAGASVALLRLPNVFGKWCRPDYNSVVATFCHRTARGQCIEVHDSDAALELVYIDDVVSGILALLDDPAPGCTSPDIRPVHRTTVGALAAQIQAFADSRSSFLTERVGTGLTRALYATYISYLEPANFAYGVPKYEDARGVFVEMLKTKDSGQFSFFTAHPGVTRGGHYHHSKTEKFLVIKGEASFRFRHLVTNERFTINTDGADPVIVETIPGWVHDITNVGESELVVMLWANEVFDRERPDTVASPM